MTKFLLDENLSPKVSRHLERQHGLDALPLRQLGRIGMPDTNVRDLDLRHGRVIITLDSDFTSGPFVSGPARPGVLWLNPASIPHRSIETYKQMLDRFCRDDAPALDLEHSIIEVGVTSSVVLHQWT